MPAKVKNALHGWLVIDKPYGMGSTQVVGRLKYLFHPTKIGHGGTLDPLATGVLPIAFGQATRTVPFVMNGKKIYQFTVKFGEQTSTDDIEGDVIATSVQRPTTAQIESLLPSFVGDILQTPPAYSAIKVQGKRAYALARSGADVVIQPRTVHIESLKLLAHTTDTADFEVVCGKGTYVRSLGRDIAIGLGTVGHITALRRTACGVFSLADTITLDKLEKSAYTDRPNAAFIPVQAVLTDILELAVTADEALALSHGRSLRKGRLPDKDLMQATFEGSLIAFVTVKDNVVRPVKVFNNNVKGENDVDC